MQAFDCPAKSKFGQQTTEKGCRTMTMLDINLSLFSEKLGYIYKHVVNFGEGTGHRTIW